MSRPRHIVILGGSGFVGRHLLTRLSQRGHRLVVLSRNRERARALGVLPGVTLHNVDVYSDETLKPHLLGSDALVNLIGILDANSKQNFQQVHVELPRRLIQACLDTGVPHLHQMSALKAGQGLSVYLKSRGETESVIRESKLDWTLYKPSLIFGRGDHLVEHFARLLRSTPVFPLPRGQVRLAPTWVGDVAEAMARCVEHPLESRQQSYELYGPQVLSLSELVQQIRDAARLSTRIIEIPDNLGKLQAQLAQWLPGRPFTLDQFRTLRTDSVGKHDGYARLGIQPQPIGPWLPLLLNPQAETSRLAGVQR